MIKGEDVLLDLEEGVLVVGGGHHPESDEVTIRIRNTALKLCVASRR